MAIIESSTGFVAVGNTFNGTDWDVVVLDLDALGSIVGSPYSFGEIKENGLPGDEKALGINILNDGVNDYYMIAGYTTAAISENVPGTDLQDYYALRLDINFMEDPIWAQNNKIMGRDEPDYGLMIYEKVNDPTTQIMLGYVDSPRELGFDDDTFSSWQYIGSENGADDYYGDTNSQICEDVSPTIDG